MSANTPKLIQSVQRAIDILNCFTNSQPDISINEISARTGINVNTCEDPEECVVRGLVKIVSDNKYKHLAFSMKSKILI